METKQIRSQWGNFPPIIRNGDLKELEKHSLYLNAKQGDFNAALILIKDCIKQNFIKEIQNFFDIKKCDKYNCLLQPVLANEQWGDNKIPLALSFRLSQILKININTSIIQIDKVARTNKGAFYRLLYNPLFEGEVIKNMNYFLLDDTLTMGGTIANLKGYIENNGGKVVGGAVMTAFPTALNIQIQSNMYQGILDKFGKENINNLIKDFFYYDLSKFTQAEAGHIKSKSTIEQIRDIFATTIYDTCSTTNGKIISKRRIPSM